MKKLGIVILAVALLLGCASCISDYKEIKPDAVEPVGSIPAFWEDTVIPDDYASYGTQVGNVLLYETYSAEQTTTLVAHDVVTESTKTLSYAYKTEAYYLNGIYPTKDGNFFLLLTANAYTDTDLLPMIVKSDLEGNVLWETALQNPNFTTATGLTESDNGDIYVVGYTTNVASDVTQEQEEAIPLSEEDIYNEYYEEFFGTYDDEDVYDTYENHAYVAKLDARGNRILETTVGSTIQSDYLSDAVYLEGVGLITAYATSTDAYEQETSLLCLDENCSVVWQTALDTTHNAFPYLEYINGQIYCCIQGDYDCTIVAFNSTGKQLWSQTFTDDVYATVLTHVSEQQLIVSRTDECFTINAADGSVDRYLWTDEVGTIYITYTFDDYYVVYSDHICGGYYDGFIRMGDLYESVYSAYDYDGNLLWRKGFTS